MSRKTARDAIFKIVFEECVTGEKPDITFQLLTEDAASEDLAFIESTVSGVSKVRSFLKQTIVKYAVGFALERIYKIDLAILLVASYEILFSEVPEKVAASEAVELAKIYSTDKSAPFINGMLASVIKDKAELLKDYESFVEEESKISETIATNDELEKVATEDVKEENIKENANG